jgi:preprotein translocase subunit SecF
MTLYRGRFTGGTVLLTVLALYFFGGPVLNDFAFSFVVGVVVGTYFVDLYRLADRALVVARPRRQRDSFAPRDRPKSGNRRKSSAQRQSG